MNIYIASCVKRPLQNKMAATSKAFRANVGQLREHEATNLQRFVQRTCAVSNLFRSDRGSTVLIALRDIRRNSASHARSIRAWMKQTGIPTAGLRGHWCTLITDAEALALCAASCQVLPIVRDEPPAKRPPYEDASDAKTIRLY